MIITQAEFVMKCQNCQFENHDTKKFGRGCGAEGWVTRTEKSLAELA